MTEIAKQQQSFNRLHTSIVAISADTIDQSRAFREERGFAFRLLCDPERKVISQFNLLNPYEHGGIAYPAIFIVKPGGTIGYRSLDRTAKRVNLSQIIGYLEAVQQCPDLLQEAQSSQQVIIPSGSDLLQVARNMFKRGDRSDWKHYLSYPLILLKMPFRKR